MSGPWSTRASATPPTSAAADKPSLLGWLDSIGVFVAVAGEQGVDGRVAGAAGEAGRCPGGEERFDGAGVVAVVGVVVAQSPDGAVQWCGAVGSEGAVVQVGAAVDE